MRVGIVAGEHSGDQLAAGLMQALRERVPQIQFEAVAGPRMQAVGCDGLADADELAVMGLAEVLPEVTRLWRLRRRLIQHWADHRPDVFVGVDAPDFTLGLERALKQRGVPTVHYVSPTVWAWRAGRVKTIARAAGDVLCLYPFEPACYSAVDVRAHYVGHPFATAMAALPDAAQCRLALGLAPQARVLLLAPGSRRGEVAQVLPAMLAAAARLQAADAELVVLVPAASAERHQQIAAAAAAYSPLRLTIVDDAMRPALRAADVAIVTSGTATLETLLAGTPMAVVYRASPFTNFLMRDLGLLKSRYVSLPNVLAQTPLVPEFLQEQVEAPALVRAVRVLLDNPGAREQQRRRFAEIATQLDQPTNQLAADAVLAACRR
ncbi:MAG: lipid-A-disaccharide synthase [Oceanococcaceae bacterium]